MGIEASENSVQREPQNIDDRAPIPLDNSLFRLLFEQSPAANFLLDGERFITCNLAAVRMMLCSSQQEFLALHPFQISPDCQPDGCKSSDKALAMIAIACTEGSHRFEWVYRRLNGEEIWVDVVLTAIAFADRQLIHAVCRDISQQKQLELERQQVEAAVQQSEMFRSIIDNIPGAFCRVRCDETWTVEFVSSMFAEICGYPVSDFLEHKTRTLLDLPHADDAAWVDQTIREAIANHKPYALEYRIYHGDGSIHWIYEKGQALYDENGEPIWADGVWLDITERKQAELMLNQSKETAESALYELQQLQTQLVQAEKMSSLGQLVAGVAHEINNPVNFIQGNLTYATEYTQDLFDLLSCYQQEYPDLTPALSAALERIDLDFLREDSSKVLTSMKLGVDRIRGIVRSLRNFSRLDEAEFKAVDIHEGIDSTLLILQSRLKPKFNHPGIQVIKTYGQLPLIACYAGQLNQVFMNVLVNALDALEERDQERSIPDLEQNPSCIWIHTQLLGTDSSADSSTASNPDQVAIHITDNGPGIPEAVKQRIFDPFFTTKPIGKGTGLGMSISYQIVVEKHGGSLECESQPGQGTNFCIQIPVRKNE
jgi:PAS domain S-box-containing protein